jgi:hypothetical protein
VLRGAREPEPALVGERDSRPRAAVTDCGRTGATDARTDANETLFQSGFAAAEVVRRREVSLGSWRERGCSDRCGQPVANAVVELQREAKVVW